MNISFTKIKNGEFTGFVDKSELPDDVVSQLKSSNLDFELEIAGEFNVWFDDDMPSVEMTALYIIEENGNFVDINLSKVKNLDTLEEDLAQSEAASNWYMDYKIAQAEHMYDSYKDSLYED